MRESLFNIFYCSSSGLPDVLTELPQIMNCQIIKIIENLKKAVYGTANPNKLIAGVI